jgi:hypothetical protein
MFRVLVIPLIPSATSVIVTPPTPDTNTEEMGFTQVILGLGKPEAEQLKEVETGDVTVTFSGG